LRERGKIEHRNSFGRYGIVKKQICWYFLVKGQVMSSKILITVAAVNYVEKALGELTSGKEVSIPKTRPYGCTVKYAR